MQEFKVDKDLTVWINADVVLRETCYNSIKELKDASRNLFEYYFTEIFDDIYGLVNDTDDPAPEWWLPTEEQVNWFRKKTKGVCAEYYDYFEVEKHSEVITRYNSNTEWISLEEVHFIIKYLSRALSKYLRSVNQCIEDEMFEYDIIPEMQRFVFFYTSLNTLLCSQAIGAQYITNDYESFKLRCDEEWTKFNFSYDTKETDVLKEMILANPGINADYMKAFLKSSLYIFSRNEDIWQEFIKNINSKNFYNYEYFYNWRHISGLPFRAQHSAFELGETLYPILDQKLSFKETYKLLLKHFHRHARLTYVDPAVKRSNN